MKKTIYDRGGQSRCGVISFALIVVMAAWLAVSCGNSENGPPAVSWSDEPALKAVSEISFSTGVVDEYGEYSSIGYDTSGYPAIAYITEDGDLYYAKWDGSDWDDQVEVDSLTDYCVSLAFDSSNAPSIAYYNPSSRALMWAYDEDDDGEWDDNEDWPMEIHSDVGFWNPGERNCSHDISGNTFGFAWYDENYGKLRYFSILGDFVTTWLVDVDTDDDVGKYCSLDLKSGGANHPSISYYDADNGYLKFARFDYPDWDAEVVDDGSGDDIGMYSSLSYKSSSVPTIAYYNNSDSEPWLVIWNTSTSEWDPTCLYGNPGLYYYCGLHISHDWDPITATKGGFSFLEWNLFAGTWRLVFVLYDGEDYTTHYPDGYGGGMYTSFVWEDDDIGWISHYENSFNPRDPRDLRYVMVDDS